MTNFEKYDQAFMELFKLEQYKLNVDLVYMSISGWDSIGHMTLISTLENMFDIMMETDDIIEFSSYEKGKEILRRYGVEL